MNDTANELSSLAEICHQQYDELERKRLQIWDVEEENRLLRIRIQELQGAVDKHMKRVDDLERWCGHLQGIIDAEKEQRETRERQYQQLEQRYGILFRIARKVKRLLVR